MSTKKKNIDEVIKFPEGVNFEIVDSVLKIKGPKGYLERKFFHPSLKIIGDNDSIKLENKRKKFSKNEKRMIKTFKAHIVNMIRGANEGFSYHLKIVSGHFPMSVALEGQSKFTIKNFLGEKAPRTANLLPNVKASIKGDEITIESPDREAAGQSAANLETATRITNRDRRIFQDGIYITKKPERHKK